ncbi:MAG: signal peptidase I [Actinomycetota bacterium]|nr:signal peptidase I [Actinomycetota bacterium]
MTDLRTRLRDIERLDPPELWPDIATRMPGALPPQRHRGRVMAVLVAAAVIGAGVVAPLTLLRSDQSIGTGGEPGNLIAVTMVSEAMEPTLHVGDTVDVDPDAYQPVSPSPGDVIVFERLPVRGDIIAFHVPDHPDFVLIKRVIGLPGDVVEERDGIMYVNDSPIAVPQPAGQQDSRTLGPWRVEAGRLFVVGDNLVNSNDSRFALGQIPFGEVLGKVVGVDTALSGSPSPAPPAPAMSNPSPQPSPAATS